MTMRARRALSVCSLMFAGAASLHAYVDPGFASALYQLLYTLLFGSFAAALLAPWRAIRQFVRHRFSRKPEEPSGGTAE